MPLKPTVSAAAARVAAIGSRLAAAAAPAFKSAPTKATSAPPLGGASDVNAILAVSLIDFLGRRRFGALSDDTKGVIRAFAGFCQ